MIIFHEGLPGSGKSYEAMVSRIIPSLAKGRQVVAYVEGLDFQKIADLAQIPLARCQELLTSLTREQVDADWVGCMRPNAMHVLDEAQNFWGNRKKFSAAETKMVTEHRHEGMDIVLMGQDLRDVHATWRRRVEVKLCFLKLNGFGKFFAKKYSCTTFRHLGGDEFKRVGLKVTAYDVRYFGTYKSHVSEETNTEDYSDERAQVLSHPLIKYAVPAALVAGLIGIWQVRAFFHPEPEKPAAAVHARPTSAAASSVQQSAPLASALVAPVPAVVAAADDHRSLIERRLAELAGKGRIRLAGLVTMGERTSGIVEWVQGGTVVVERLSLDALRTLGVGVLISGDTVQLAVGAYTELATPWPFEDAAGHTNARQVAVRGPQPMTGGASLPDGLGQAAAPPTFRDLPGPITGGATLERRVLGALQ